MDEASALQVWKRGLRGFDSRNEFVDAMVSALGQPRVDEALLRVVLDECGPTRTLRAISILARHPGDHVRALMLHQVRRARITGNLGDASGFLPDMYRQDPAKMFPSLALAAAKGARFVESVGLLLECVLSKTLPVDCLYAIAYQGGGCSWVDALHSIESVPPRLYRLVQAVAWHTSAWSRGPAIGWLLSRDRPLALVALQTEGPLRLTRW